MGLDDQQARQRAQRLDQLLAQVESMPAPVRGSTLELLQTILELYGEGLARIVGMLREVGEHGRLADDELVGYLLLLHGLHPLDAPARVRRALARVRPRLHGAEPELVSVDGALVRLRLTGAGGCRSTAAQVRASLEAAVRDAAPEIDRVEVEQAAPPPVLIPVESLRAGGTVPAAG